MPVAAAPLVFDRVSHRYTLGGRELISVTQALKESGLVDDRFYTDESAQRGTYVHEAIQLLDQGTLAIDSLEPSLRPYVTAYERFCEATRPEWSHIEHRVYDEILGYAGTLDRAGTLSTGVRILLDVKTGTVPYWVGAQLSAYRRCLPNPHTYMRAALQLKADGSFTLHECTDRQDEKTFLAALHLAQIKRQHR